MTLDRILGRLDLYGDIVAEYEVDLASARGPPERKLTVIPGVVEVSPEFGIDIVLEILSPAVTPPTDVPIAGQRVTHADIEEPEAPRRYGLAPRSPFPWLDQFSDEGFCEDLIVLPDSVVRE